MNYSWKGNAFQSKSHSLTPIPRGLTAAAPRPSKACPELVDGDAGELTSQGPAIAQFNSKLVLAYNGKDSDDIGFNTFDGANWLAQDLEVARDGYVQTGRGPALAAFAPFPILAYRDNN